ncbi:gliding motility-associated C-terminal domain-containing protein [Cytophagales bacterium LB-30]|uniref:Gliding motility-associated C-terminal domain-containing protein n=1 Tax=Shiella aurantiaca TaxID=3058365 RepID=A0ABT8F6K3_9BACT|nr:gliding motility-associated C-terminal domain-containing protein [Shiella aurantiaca]MDN4165995.1 gliding motility-associated C-terminal domain-containing protein [Shiella aurantiaca]
MKTGSFVKKYLAAGVILISLTAQAQQLPALFEATNDSVQVGNSTQLVAIKAMDWTLNGQAEIVAAFQENDTLSFSVFEPENDLEHLIPSFPALKMVDWQGMNYFKSEKNDLVIAYQETANHWQVKGLSANRDFNLITEGEGVLQAIQWADVDHDGHFDFIATLDDVDSLRHQVYVWNGVGFELCQTWASKEVGAIGFVDFTHDSYVDVLVSSRSEGKSQFWVNQGDGSFIPDRVLEDTYFNSVQSIDFNADGRGDFLLVDSTAKQAILIFQKEDTVSIGRSFSFSNAQAKVFAADFNHDGVTDIAVADDSLRLYTQVDSVFTHSYSNVLHDAALLDWGHFTNDGNLDVLIASAQSDNQLIHTFKNSTTSVNVGPTDAFLYAGFFDGSRLIVFWDETADDATASASLSYDISVFTADEQVIAPDFQLGTFKKSFISRGNVGMAHEFSMPVNNPAQGYEFRIQVIDNAFMPSTPVGGACIPCSPEEMTTTNLCAPDIMIQEDQLRGWYSSSGGFLGFSDSFQASIDYADTLFSVLPNTLLCHQQKRYIIQVLPEEPLATDTTVCLGANLIYELSDEWIEAQWVTSANVQLSDSTALYFQAISNTIIYVEATHTNGCIKKDTFQIEVNTLDIDLLPEQDLCADEPVSLSLNDEYEWGLVEWRLPNHQLTGNSLPIVFTPAVNDWLILSASTTSGCLVGDSVAIRVHQVVAQVGEESLTIFKGEEIALQANGGTNYEWSPAIGLSDVFSSKPMASPLETIQYQVEVSDEWGCTALAFIEIQVLNRSFAPNLFSPNNDGQNDAWKLIELEDVQEFQLVIVDREGNRVYQTQSDQEAMQIGWDGTKDGNLLPAGVYFWKVSGVYTDGHPIKVNGTSEGQIILMR